MSSDHYWSQLLAKIIYTMPDGVLEHIVEYIPTPRIWTWSLHRLKKRIQFATNASIEDCYRIIDEILTDR
jgi:hypothetical protein